MGSTELCRVAGGKNPSAAFAHTVDARSLDCVRQALTPLGMTVPIQYITFFIRHVSVSSKFLRLLPAITRYVVR